jgi:hypothetical protein
MAFETSGIGSNNNTFAVFDSLKVKNMKWLKKLVKKL